MSDGKMAAAKAKLAAADVEPVAVDGGEVVVEPIKPVGIRAKLARIQLKLRVNKNRGKGHNPTAGVSYEYRNAEDILEAVKPLAAELGTVVTVTVEPRVIGESVPVEVRCVGKDRNGVEQYALLSGPRFAAVATAVLTDFVTGETVGASSFAFVDAWRKGQTEPEKLCGSADSYASKYALGHLFALDNNRDADQESDEAGRKPAPVESEF